MDRLSPLTEAELTTEQRAVFDAIAGGPRGNMGLIGPFGVYVRAPGVGNAAQALGAAVRFSTELPENLKEIGICVVGAHTKAKFEFAAHAVLAQKAGVAPDIVESIRIGEAPEFSDDNEALAYEVAIALVRRHRLDDALYARAKAALGETQLVELVAAVGYYTLVSYMLNAFEIPLREGMTDPFPEV